MRARTNTLFPLALMVALAALTFWLERAVEVGAGADHGLTRHDADFMAENFTATQLDVTGRPEYSLTARKMVHYPDDESTELDHPRLVQLRVDAPPLRVRSDRGTVTKDGKEVHFYDNVVVTRDATPSRPELRVDTSYLMVLPDPDIARTPERVVITEAGSRLSGVGMEANNKTHEFELKSDVHGTYVRPPDTPPAK